MGQFSEIIGKVTEFLKASMTLFAGFIGVVIGVCSTQSLARKERKRDRLHSQLTQLYGPIYYRILQNSKLFERNKKCLEGHKELLEGKNWSRDADTQKANEEISTKMLKLANNYLHEVVKNNERIKLILDDHFGLCDPKDMEVFNSFYEHYVRYKTEVEGAETLPMEIRNVLGDISFMKPEFSQQIEKCCKAKQKEYLKLTS